jgi:ABC-type sugar transport system ATPase subunit
MASNVLVMNEGRIMQIDWPEQLYEKPTSLFLAGFVGSPPMNFIDITYEEKDGTASINAGEFHYDVTPLKQYLEAHKNSSLVMGVRPEYISVGKSRSTANAINGKVELLEPLMFKANIRPAAMGVGDNVWASFDPKKMLFFEKSSGKAIV